MQKLEQGELAVTSMAEANFEIARMKKKLSRKEKEGDEAGYHFERFGKRDMMNRRRTVEKETQLQADRTEQI